METWTDQEKFEKQRVTSLLEEYLDRKALREGLTSIEIGEVHFSGRHWRATVYLNRIAVKFYFDGKQWRRS